MGELDALGHPGRAAGVGEQDDVAGVVGDGGRLAAGGEVAVAEDRADARSASPAIVTTIRAPESRSWAASSPAV
jgi:hypothetical protein